MKAGAHRGNMWGGSACASWVCLPSGATPGGGSGSSATPPVAGPHRIRSNAGKIPITYILIIHSLGLNNTEITFNYTILTS